MHPLALAAAICGVGGVGLLCEALVLERRGGPAVSKASLWLLVVGGTGLLALSWMLLNIGVGTPNTA